jgi:hypothetical protein
MKEVGLSERELALIRGVLSRRPEVSAAILYGPRAKGTPRPESDVDLALEGDLMDYAPSPSPPSWTNCRCRIDSAWGRFRKFDPRNCAIISSAWER